MVIRATKLRANIFQILDRVLETGVPVEVERKGRKLRIVCTDDVKRTRGLKKRAYLKGDPEEIVHLDWSDEWRP